MWLFFPTSVTYSWWVGDEKTDQKSTKNIKIIKFAKLQKGHLINAAENH